MTQDTHSTKAGLTDEICETVWNGLSHSITFVMHLATLVCEKSFSGGGRAMHSALGCLTAEQGEEGFHEDRNWPPLKRGSTSNCTLWGERLDRIEVHLEKVNKEKSNG